MKRLNYHPQNVLPKAKGAGHVRQYDHLLILRGQSSAVITDEAFEELCKMKQFLGDLDSKAITVSEADSEAPETKKTYFAMGKTAVEMIDEIEKMENIDTLREILRTDDRKTVKKAARQQIKAIRTEDEDEES